MLVLPIGESYTSLFNILSHSSWCRPRCLGIHEEEGERCQGGTTLEDDDMLPNQRCSRPALDHRMICDRLQNSSPSIKTYWGSDQWAGIDRTIDRRTRAYHQNLLRKRPMKGHRLHTIECPPVLDRTYDCNQAYMGFYLIFLRFYLLKRLSFTYLFSIRVLKSLFHTSLVLGLYIHVYSL